MSVAYSTVVDHPITRILRAARARVEGAADRIHASGDDQLRAQGFIVTRVPGWFGLITHREISHPAVNARIKRR
jgi:hypothetical protein